MTVTLYTDASHIPGTTKGAWAYWAKSERGRLQDARAFKEVPQIDNAELRCVLNAVWYIQKVWPNTTEILIVCDSKSALGLLENANQYKPGYQMRFSAELQMWDKLKVKCNFRYRHQKGHAKDHATNIAAWLNRWCDNQACIARKGNK